MSGKRAKPSPWRFLRTAPVVVVAVVWVLVGFFLLLPGSGTDQAHDWGVEPIPSSSDDAGTGDLGSFPTSSPDSSTLDTEASRRTSPAPEDAPSSKHARAASPDPALSGASPAPKPKPAPPPTSDLTTPAPTQPASGHGSDDNPGKKKGHDKPHGPPRAKP